MRGIRLSASFCFLVCSCEIAPVSWRSESLGYILPSMHKRTQKIWLERRERMSVT